MSTRKACGRCALPHPVERLEYCRFCGQMVCEKCSKPANTRVVCRLCAITGEVDVCN